MTSPSNIKYNGRTWHIKIVEEDKALIEWHDPKKPHHVSNYALRWVCLSVIGGAGFYNIK